MLVIRRLNSYHGVTLVELLLIIAVLSVFMVIYATSEPTLSEERQAALTVAKTYDLMRAAHLYYESNHLSWPDNEALDEFLLDQNPRVFNAFGEPYFFESSAGRFVVYQLVPEKWSGYILNSLERTRVLTDSEANASPLAEEYSELDDLLGRGYAALQSTIDQYGNLHFAFVRRQFETHGLFEEELRENPEYRGASDRGTQAIIYKPDCEVGEPKIHYTVRGVCSFYPYHYYDQDLFNEMWGTNSQFSLDKNYWYTTQGYRFSLEDYIENGDPVWRISLDTYERWYVRTIIQEGPDADGEMENVPHHEKKMGWSPSQELCGQPTHGQHSYNNAHLDNEDNPSVYNHQFFEEDYLLYVDAWVSCQ